MPIHLRTQANWGIAHILENQMAKNLNPDLGLPNEPQKNHSADDSNQASGGKNPAADSNQKTSCSEPNLLPAKNDEAQSFSKTKSRRENIKFLVEIAGVIGGLIGVVFLIFQYAEMVRATKVTQGQLVEMQKARILDERAWIAAYGITMGSTEEKDGFMYFTVDYKNTGKTPALNTQIIIKTTGDKKIIARHDEMPNSPTSAGLTAPDGVGFTRIKAPAQAVRDVHTMYVYGTIWYDDVFGSHHWSQFCYTIQTDANFNMTAGPSDIHNSCDDAEGGKAD